MAPSGDLAPFCALFRGSNNWYDNDDVYVAYGNDGYYGPGPFRTHRGGHRSKHDVEQTKTTTEPNGAEYNCEMLHSSVLRYVGRVDYMDGFAFDFVGVSGSGCNFDHSNLYEASLVSPFV